MEAIVIASIFVGYVMAGVLTGGPHQETPSECEKTTIVSDSTGEVLYYNCK
jgi:hypothetical protein